MNSLFALMNNEISYSINEHESKLMNIFIVLRQGGIQVLLIRPLEVWNQENL